MPLGSQVKKYRTAAGCTYADIEAMSGVSTGNINALEKRNSSRSEHMLDLARAFGLTIDQLLDETTDHSDQVRAHVSRWRQTKTLPPVAQNVREPTIPFGGGYWPFAVPQERLRAALSKDDIQLVDAYMLALVQMRETEQGKAAPRESNGLP